MQVVLPTAGAPTGATLYYEHAYNLLGGHPLNFLHLIRQVNVFINMQNQHVFEESYWHGLDATRIAFAAAVTTLSLIPRRGNRLGNVACRIEATGLAGGRRGGGIGRRRTGTRNELRRGARSAVLNSVEVVFGGKGGSLMPDSSNNLPKLELPKRWELLDQRAREAGLEPEQFVEKVDAAAERVDQLMDRVRTGGGGLFEVFYGLSGSGKTTFLKTLPRFFTSIRVASFPKEEPLMSLPSFVSSTHTPGDPSTRIVLVEKRDNPTPADLASVDEMLAQLLDTFRTPEGGALVLWPITREPVAKSIAAKAWEAGRDSLVDSGTKGFYNFVGVARDRYLPIADTTSRNLTGDGTEAFGITPEVGRGLVSGCETISDFFAAVNHEADKQRGKTWSVLKERVRARVWVLLPGDLVAPINTTASALTQGTRNRIDIDLIAEFIDREDNQAVYIADWRNRRAALAHLLRAIDVRLFPIPPNVALAAVRAFGESTLKTRLKQSTVARDQAKDAMKASRLYKAILGEAGITTTPFAGGREVSAETSDEYRRIQVTAAGNDKPLNKAVGLLIKTCLEDDAPSLEVIAEKRSLPGSQLQPDIQIKIGEMDYICLEPTWRSTGVGIPATQTGGTPEIAETQNTMTEAHIKKYVLEKATQYIKDLGL